jgi:hypothetical protein
MTICSKFFYSIKQYFRHSKAIVDHCKDIKNNTPIILLCNPIDTRFKEYAVQTTHKEIMDMLDKLNNRLEKDEQWKNNQNIKGESSKLCNRKIMNDIFNKIYCNIIKYSDKELNNLYEKQNGKWFEWCDDVMLYHCYNKVLNEQLIPTDIPNMM